MLGSLIGAAGSLLGGLFSKPPSARQQTYGGIMGQAQGARDAAAQYGFNPLTLLGVSSTLGGGSGGMMGSAIADAFALMANGLAAQRGVGEKEALTRENAGLRQQLTRQTLQPEVPGVYARIEQQPVIGGNNAPSAGPQSAGPSFLRGDAAAVRPLPDRLETDPRRQVEHDPVRTHSGFMTIDNPSLPFSIHVPTLDGDEALQWYDVPSLGLWGGLSAIDHYLPMSPEEAGRAVRRRLDDYWSRPSRSPRPFRTRDHRRAAAPNGG